MLFIRAITKDKTIDFSTPSMDIDKGKELVRLISSTNKEAIHPNVVYCRNSIANKFGKAVVTVSLNDTDDNTNLVSYTYST
jgi:hypothetical protein